MRRSETGRDRPRTASHAGGRRFKSCIVHHSKPCVSRTRGPLCRPGARTAPNERRLEPTARSSGVTLQSIEVARPTVSTAPFATMARPPTRSAHGSSSVQGSVRHEESASRPGSSWSAVTLRDICPCCECGHSGSRGPGQVGQAGEGRRPDERTPHGQPDTAGHESGRWTTGAPRNLFRVPHEPLQRPGDVRRSSEGCKKRLRRWGISPDRRLPAHHRRSPGSEASRPPEASPAKCRTCAHARRSRNARLQRPLRIRERAIVTR